MNSGWVKEYLDEDGLHLSPGGNRFVHERLLDVLQSHYPDLLPKALPKVGGAEPTEATPWGRQRR